LVIRVGRNGTCLSVAGETGLLGQARIVGRPVAEALPSVVATAGLECMQQAFATGGLHLRECRFPVSGEPRDFELRVLTSGPEEALFLLRETSRRKQMTEEATTGRELLERQLQQAQRMAAVGRLASGVAHDFNNLLTVIAAYAHMLREEPPDSSLARNHVEEILRTVERASALTCQLLAFSRRQVEPPRTLDLNELVLGMDQMLRRVIPEDIELVTALGAAPGMIGADPAQIEQVIVNLVVNARDAIPEGGRITIETGSHLGPDRRESVMLSVTDTGVGMDEETKARIFEPFFTTKDQGRGTGLGLATVDAIVRDSGGEIAVTTAPGQGTRIAVYFPRVSQTPPERTVGPADAAHPCGTETLLVVEDEDNVRRLVSEALEQHGYTVLATGQPREAIAICAGHVGAIDLLLADLVLPRMHGVDLAQRARSIRPGIRVLFMSGYTDNAAAPASAPFLRKPFTPAALALKVREVLDAQRGQAHLPAAVLKAGGLTS
jgi:two-component system cell cycle sensor histidine kinase/response regulator CckA